MANGTIAASQIEMLSQSGTGIITITPPATNTNRAITLPDAAGAIVVSGTTPSLNGITFPATQVPSADANTLDDYEEGTFTPTLGGSTTNPTGVTYIVQSASYRKIGSLVHVTGQIAFSTYTGGSGYLVVNGLPFSANVASNWGTAMTESIDYAAGKTCVATLIDNGTVRISLIFGGDNVAYDTGAIGTVAASSGTAKYVTYGISYFV